MKKEDIKTEVTEEGIVISLKLKESALLPMFAQDMHARTKISVATEEVLEKMGSKEPLYIYNSDEDIINLIVCEETATKLMEKGNGFSVQYRLWDKEKENI